MTFRQVMPLLQPPNVVQPLIAVGTATSSKNDIMLLLLFFPLTNKCVQHPSDKDFPHRILSMATALFVCDLHPCRTLRPDIVEVSTLLVKCAKILNIPVCVGEQTSQRKTSMYG